MKPYYEHAGITIYHGDCREVVKVIGLDWAFGAIVSDPPYGQSFASNREGRFKDIAITGDETTELRDWLVDVAISRNVPAVIFGSAKVARPTKALRQVLIWDKGEYSGGLGNIHSPWKHTHEEIYVIGDGIVVGESMRRGSVLQYPASVGVFQFHHNREHPTQKPESLLRHLISVCPAGFIFDPFAGSGTTLCASKVLGRKAVGIEIEERYCEIAAERLRQEVLPWAGGEAHPMTPKHRFLVFEQ